MRTGGNENGRGGGAGHLACRAANLTLLIQHKHGLIGAPVSRLDGQLKVTGAAPFAAEFPVEGMVYAALVYSTIPEGPDQDTGYNRC